MLEPAALQVPALQAPARQVPALQAPRPQQVQWQAPRPQQAQPPPALLVSRRHRNPWCDTMEDALT